MTRTKNIVVCEICGKSFHSSGLNGHMYQKHGIRRGKTPKPAEPAAQPAQPTGPAPPTTPGEPQVQSLEELFKQEISGTAPPPPSLEPTHPAFRAEGPDQMPAQPPVQPGGFSIVGWDQLYVLIAEIMNQIGNQLHERTPTMPWMPIPMNPGIAGSLGAQTSACVGPLDPKKALAGSLLLCFAPAAICIIAMLLGPKTFSKMQEKFAAFVDKKLGAVKDGKPATAA